MAKKNDRAYETFLADLKALVGDDGWAKVEETLIKNDAAATKLRAGVLAQSEFSSQMDALATERKQFEAELAEARTKIAGWQDWYGKAAAEHATLRDKVTKYEQEYGELGEEKSSHRPQYLTADDFDKRLAEEIRNRDAAAIRFADDLTDLKIEHRERFKEKLDTGSVLKIAGERQVPLDVAYGIYTKDRVEELRQKDVDEKVKAAKEEGAREFASKHNLPIIPSAPDIVHVLDVASNPTTQRERIAAAIASLGKR